MYAHCSKNEVGKEVIKKVNAILTDDFLMDYLGVIEQWYGNDEGYRQLFIKAIINEKLDTRVVDRD